VSTILILQPQNVYVRHSEHSNCKHLMLVLNTKAHTYPSPEWHWCRLPVYQT